MSGGVENTPKLRFPEFSGEWDQTTLGKVGPVSMCKRIFKDDTASSGDVPFFKIGTFGREPDAYISQEKFDEFRAKFSFPNKGDILISAAGTIGRTVVYDGAPAYFQDSNIVWVANDETKIENSFLAFCYENIRWTTEDTTIARLYNENIRSRVIFSPKKPEQQKISAFLGAVDAKIGQLTRKKALLEDYKKGCMQQLFTQKLRFKDDQGNDFRDWEEKQLGDVCEINPRSSALPDVFFYIDLESVSQGQLAAAKLVEKRDAPSRAQRLLEPHDVLFQLVRPYQKNNYFFDRPEIHVASTGYAQLRASENPIFLFQLVHEQGFVNRVLERCTGTNYPAINSNDLAKVAIQMPHPDEQQKIADFLSAIDAKISLVADELSAAQDFKKGLLQQMFV